MKLHIIWSIIYFWFPSTCTSLSSITTPLASLTLILPPLYLVSTLPSMCSTFTVPSGYNLFLYWLVCSSICSCGRLTSLSPLGWIFTTVPSQNLIISSPLVEIVLVDPSGKDIDIDPSGKRIWNDLNVPNYQDKKGSTHTSSCPFLNCRTSLPSLCVICQVWVWLYKYLTRPSLLLSFTSPL